MYSHSKILLKQKRVGMWLTFAVYKAIFTIEGYA